MLFSAFTLILMQTACQTFWLFLICHFVSKENALLWAYPNAFRLFGSTEIMAAARRLFALLSMIMPFCRVKVRGAL